MQLGKDSWGLAAILVLSQVVAGFAVMVLLSSVLGFGTRIPLYAALMAAAATGTWLRIAYKRRSWLFEVRDRV